MGGAGFQSLIDHIDTNTPAGRLMLPMLGAFAEFEREMIRERNKSGMQAGEKRGVRLGRPRSLEVDEERQVVRQWRSGRYSLTALAHQYGASIFRASNGRFIARPKSLSRAYCRTQRPMPSVFLFDGRQVQALRGRYAAT